jgi:hypothetical protein
MKHNSIILMTIVLGLTFFGCKKDPQETLTPKITESNVEVTATTATFTWTVEWPGKLISVVEVSENEDMSHSQIFGSEDETENHSFTVTVTDLKLATKYYYRYLVWNKYYVDNKFVKDRKFFNTLTTGIINGKFSVSVLQQVYFSQGNLQYRASDGCWRFAEHQYDYIGNANSNISSTYNNYIDLFGWGTSGWNNGNTYYHPWDSYNGNGSGCLYGPSGYNAFTGSYANADWGVYNAISNGGDRVGLWRTLEHTEWGYVFDTRSTPSGIRYAKACVNNVNGVILLPDDWSSSYYSLNSTNTSEASFSSNTITLSQWNTLEQHGAVFLPAAGYRDGTFVYIVGSGGIYWSASYCRNDYAYNVFFYDSFLHSRNSHDRYYGRSVRLVCDVE